MAYDKKTGTITTNGDEKQFERDMFRHFEEVTRKISEEQNAPPSIAKMHEQYREMNKAADDIENIEAFVRKARAFKLAQMVQSIPAQKPKKDMVERIRSLPRLARVAVVCSIFWTMFVAFRTLDSHYVLGIYLDRWSWDDFLVNWLALPAIVAALFFGVRWALFEKRDTPAKVPNPLSEFEHEIANWPADQGKTALLLIKATLYGDGELIDRLTKELTVEQFRKVVETVKKMEQLAG